MRGMGNFLAAASLGALTMHSALAGPTGENIVGGSAVITRPDVSTTVIDQSSQRVVIEWGSFNVGATERVEFVQPDATAAALNRILDQNPSQILGSIEANGRVLLINPNGIIFGSNAWVNVGSLIASSLDLDNDAFLNTDNWVFGNAGGATGGLVLNQGLLEAASDISLFGGAVENTGSIVVAELGRVNLAAGSQVTVDFDGDGLLQFAVSGAVAENLDARAAAVANAGSISAPGGQVLLSAEVANDVFAQVVNNQGVIAAGDVVTENGRVFLVGVGGDVVNSGEITASELGMEASGSIASNAAIEAGALELIAGEGISIGAADISVTGNAGFTAGGDVRLDGHISAFRIDVSSGGSIEGSGLLSSGVLRLAAGEGIGAAGNAMNIAAEELVLSAGNGAYLQEADDIILAGIDVASGNFSLVAAGDILQSGSINVLAGATRLEANDITANDADNVFGDSLSLTGRNVAVTSSGALTFGDSDISGTLTVTANGDISDAGMMQVLGNATFDAGGNAITLDGADGTGSDFNAVGVVSASNVSIVDVNGVTLGHAGSGINAATLTVNAASAHVAGAVTLAGALDLDVAGDFVSDGTIAAGSVDVLAGGSTTINADIASTGAIRLQSGTDLAVASRVEAQDSVSLVAAGAISLANANIEAYGAGNDVEISGASIDLAGARVTAGEGSISLQARAGGIDDSQGEGLLAANQLSLDSAAGIGETNFINTNVTSVNAVAADGIRISEANALSVNASAGGDVELRTLNGSMTIGALETTAGDVTINVNGAGNGVTIHSLDAGDGELRVTTASGSISGPGNISAGTAVLDAGNASIILGNDPASVINFGSIDVRGGSVEINEDSAMHITRLVADSAILRAQGDITDAADAQITVSGSAVFEADGGDIILGDSAIDQFDVGTLGLRGGNAMVIADGAVNLDGVDVVTLAVQADGDVTDSGAVVATDANLRATGDIVLDHAANDFGRVEASAGGVIVLNDINSVTLDGLAAVNGIAVTAGGDIDAADLLVSGGLDDNDVVLEAGGAMTLAGIVAGGAGDVRLEAAGSIISTGNGVRADRLDIDAGGGVDLVTDVAALQAISRGAGDIVIAESNDILLDGVVNEAGAVEVTAAGAVTAAGVRATGGDITMDALDALVLAAGTTMESDGKVSLQGATLDMQGTVIATGNVEAIASLGNLGM
ncbi:MAG TPA: filamentous hemagglutinin N-terminal domain-containing protein, partial [Gammaproteobacteria bacterium]|nr:filamentous hemagglutinin N-terminal domain-containing protein [Gammaproteobacteria bacterium]